LSKLIIKEGIAALARLVDETHLEEFVDNLEYKFLGVEIVELLTNSFVYVIKVHASASS
jgi:hypothetical protein